MIIKTRHIGGGGINYPSGSIHLIIEGYNNIIAEDITDLSGKVEESFIISLEDLVDELKKQNLKILENGKTI